MSDTISNAMFTIVPIFIGCVFVFMLIYLISPKFRGKIMSRQIKATKHMMDYSKDDLASIGKTAGDVGVKVANDVVTGNEETLKNLSTTGANINKEGIAITAKAIKDGLTKEETIYCKYCGQPIDKDSKFCKHCGKEL